MTLLNGKGERMAVYLGKTIGNVLVAGFSSVFVGGAVALGFFIAFQALDTLATVAAIRSE